MDNYAGAPFTEIETVALERISFAVTNRMTPQMIQDIAFDAMKADFMAGIIVSRLRAFLWAQAPQYIQVGERPATAWDAFKACLPRRFVAWFFAPVRMVPVMASVEVIYPKLNIAMPKGVSVLRVVVDKRAGVTFRNPYGPA